MYWAISTVKPWFIVWRITNMEAICKPLISSRNRKVRKCAETSGTKFYELMRWRLTSTKVTEKENDDERICSWSKPYNLRSMVEVVVRLGFRTASVVFVNDMNRDGGGRKDSEVFAQYTQIMKSLTSHSKHFIRMDVRALPVLLLWKGKRAPIGAFT